MSKTVTVVDYGAGNLFSVEKALQAVGAEVIVSSDPKDVAKADRLIFPGVGAFSSAIRQLEKRGLKDAILDFSYKNRPMLAICLGMQMLFEKSEEFGTHPGLSIIEGTVSALRDDLPVNVRVPHIGWNTLFYNENTVSDNIIFKDLSLSASFYFVHSFSGHPKDENLVAQTVYANQAITAAVQNGYIFGVQFHPEKSGPDGLQLLRNFTRA